MEAVITYHNDIKQGSLEWHDKRLGKVGFSVLKTIIDYKTGKLKEDKNKDGSWKATTPVTRAIASVISELDTGMSDSIDFQSEAMEWGTDTEPEARTHIETKTSFQTGGVTNSLYKYFWFSPDLLDSNKGFEIKCPNSNTFVMWVIKNQIPNEHIIQVVAPFAMIPTLQEMEFFMFDPRMKTKKKHSIIIKREDYKTMIGNMEIALKTFDNMVNEYYKLFK